MFAVYRDIQATIAHDGRNGNRAGRYIPENIDFGDIQTGVLNLLDIFKNLYGHKERLITTV
ncbi:hypothetical protein [Thioclava sp. GXIMD2076]|uniref:Uncharacterized protein n=1 Tax=Thioclava kandeliae TaxID=3070818 RepID=A0ABV1SL00_9RHOB